MEEIVRVAKDERIIIFCTIHQPSTKVYNGFDKIQILSKGREAFRGDVTDALPYFERIGYDCPPNMNPGEFLMDLVNADFSAEEAVDKILDRWEESKPEANTSLHNVKLAEPSEELGADEGVTNFRRTSFSEELRILFRRQALNIIRDPILYLGRCLVFLVTNLVFAIVYLKARDFTQDQALNKMWVAIWCVGVPTNMGVVAVYSLNDEFKSILRESKNGMISGTAYVVAKTFLTFPIFFVFAIFALGIPMFAIQDAPRESFGMMIILYACVMFVFESVAECLSVWVEDPIMGMLNFMNFWFGSFLFGGYLIPQRDLYWPFEVFYYVMPFHYFVRSFVYQYFAPATFEACVPGTDSAVCVAGVDGADTVPGTAVLNGLGGVIPLFSSKDYTAHDIGLLVAIGAFYKICYICGVVYKTSRATKIHSKV
jgi:hypothetical protein